MSIVQTIEKVAGAQITLSVDLQRMNTHYPAREFAFTTYMTKQDVLDFAEELKAIAALMNEGVVKP